MACALTENSPHHQPPSYRCSGPKRFSHSGTSNTTTFPYISLLPSKSHHLDLCCKHPSTITLHLFLFLVQTPLMVTQISLEFGIRDLSFGSTDPLVQSLNRFNSNYNSQAMDLEFRILHKRQFFPYFQAVNKHCFPLALLFASESRN